MTPKQEAALRDYLQEAIMPLIEQVLVKKLGQAMSFAAKELIQPKPAQQQEPVAQVDYNERGNIRWLFGKQVPDKELLYTSPPASRPWQGLTEEERDKIILGCQQRWEIAHMIEAKLREKNAQPSKPLTDEQRKAIVVCFTSGKVSVSEVQRKLAISYNEAQKLCQSIVDLGLAEGLQLAPSLDRHDSKGDA